MNWETFYLMCFVVGFVFCAVSFLSGVLHSPMHLPKSVHFGGMHHGGSLPHGVHGTAHGAHAAHHAQHGGANFPIINPMTIAAFLTWFGGTGYLLVHYRHIWLFAGLVMASMAGTAGATVVFWFVAKVLMKNERNLNPLDYEMVGVLGRVSITIREGGTGEIIFAQEGVRKPCAARSELGYPLNKGEEVIVTRYERGVAYVRRFDELVNLSSVSPEQKIQG